LWEGGELSAAGVFKLVRDMPYARASGREPSTTIHEWKGTCSGKHYLLKALFAELGMPSKLIACTQDIRVPPEKLPPELRPLVEAGPIVDVHNYLIVETPQGETVVDATWPLSTEKLGTVVNHEFVPGRDMQVACEPLETWTVPEGQDPQAFKENLLRERYSAEELERRDVFIRAISQAMAAQKY